MKIIEINNLDFGYNNKTIFKNLTLNFESNNCYILAGLNENHACAFHRATQAHVPSAHPFHKQKSPHCK